MSEAAMEEFKQSELHANGMSFPAIEMGTGPLVLCLHGFPDNNRSFRFQLPALAAAGYRAIAPTMRGYHPDCIPADGDYSHAALAADAVGWLDDLGEESAHIIGHDHGALATSAACIAAPKRFRSAVVVAVPHAGGMNEAIGKYPSQLLKSWYVIFFQLRPLARYFVQRNDWALIEKLWRDWSPGWELPASELAGVKQTLAQPGVKEAALAYYWAKQGPLAPDGRLNSSPTTVPTLGVTGALDGCIDTRLFDLNMVEKNYPGGVELARMQGAGHFAHQEKPEEANKLFLDWLSRHS